MTIFCNKEAVEVDDSISLYSFLDKRSFTGAKGIAVALNNAIVPRSQWLHSMLKQNDQVLIITATKGG